MSEKPTDSESDHGFAPKFLPVSIGKRWEVVMVAVAGATLIIGFFGEKFFGLPALVALGFYLLSYLAGGLKKCRWKTSP